MTYEPITQAVKDVLARQIKIQAEVKGNLVETKGDYTEYLFLIFDDGRYAVFTTASNYDGPAEIEFVDYAVECHELARVGLLSQEDSNIENKKQGERANQQWQNQEREQYMRLRAKYEGKGGV